MTEELKIRNNAANVEYVRTYSSSGIFSKKTISEQISPEFILSSSLQPESKENDSHYATPSNVFPNRFVSPDVKSKTNNNVPDKVTALRDIYDVPTTGQKIGQNRKHYADITILDQSNRHFAEYDVPKNQTSNDQLVSGYAVPSPIVQSSDDETKLDHLNDLLGDLDRIYSQSKERRIKEKYEAVTTNHQDSEKC